MEPTYSIPQRPITPPSDRKSIHVQNESNIPYLDSHGEENTALKDIPYLNNEPTQSLLGDDTKPFVPSKELPQDPFADIKIRNQGTRQYKTTSRQRNDTTRRIEREVLSILQWDNPVRSGVIFGFLVGSIILSRWFSVLQIGSSFLCIVTGANLLYVNFILQGQRIVTNQDVSHPYSDVLHNERRTMIDRSSVDRYSNLLTDLSETVVRALARIVFIEKTSTSIKWMLIFFAVWEVSSVISTMNIVLIAIISAFVFPRLYISNKDIVDAHIQKGQTLIQESINKAQTTASDAVNQSYVKSRFFVAKVGTTGTDAKNTLHKTSAVLKED